MRIVLLSAVRATLRADSDPIRQALFESLRVTSRPLRVVCWLHKRLGRTIASSLLVAMYGVKSRLVITLKQGVTPRIVAVAVHANARRRVDEIASTYGEQHVSHLRTDISAALHPAGVARMLRMVLQPREMRRSFRLIRKINERYDFLVSCRCASLLGCYASSKEVLAAHLPLGVLVSSDSNPEEVGLVAAARSLTIPSVFVSHAFPTSVSPPLNFSLSILEGEAALEAYVRKGPAQGIVFLGGVEGGASRPMDPSRLLRSNPVIGIFAPKVVEWSVFAALIDDCRRCFRARQIVIRWHPSMFERPALKNIINEQADIVETPHTASLADVVNLCDWVVADTNSNVHLPVLKLGVPTVSVSRNNVLEETQADIYGFVANRIVFPTLPTLQNVPMEAVAEFYGREWAQRFQKYDAGYLQAKDQSLAKLQNALRTALREFRLPESDAH